MNRDERLARNETAFREVNEGIRAAAGASEPHDKWEFICECSITGCTDVIELTLPEYEHVRKLATAFALRPGHEIVEIEKIVERFDGFIVVHKQGDAAKIAIADA